MSSLQKGEDLLAVLLSGFGKSMIFTESQRGRAAVHPVLVICPLNSIVSDKIPQLEGLCTGMELTDENVSRVLGEPAVLIYSSAEQSPCEMNLRIPRNS